MPNKAILYIDVGNTNIKWWLVYGDMRYKGVCASQCDNFSKLLKNLKVMTRQEKLVVDDAYIASVKADEYTARLALSLNNFVSGAVYSFNVVPLLVGLSIAYKDSSTLGVDRWLGMHYAFSVSEGCVVYISAGSAITVDCVDKDGCHLGGYIAPGFGMQRSMLNTTDRSSTNDVSADVGSRFGRSTQQCVDAGIRIMLKGFVSELIHVLVALPDISSEGVKIVVSGGDAHVLSELIDGAVKNQNFKCELTLDMDAVFKGMILLSGCYQCLSGLPKHQL